MSIREVTMYQVACDWPDCEITTATDSDYYAWGDRGQAVDDWNDSEGTTLDDGRNLCSEHNFAACETDLGCDSDDPSPAHMPCCSSHKKAQCCACYRRTHFVERTHFAEVGACCSQWTEPESVAP